MKAALSFARCSVAAFLSDSKPLRSEFNFAIDSSRPFTSLSSLPISALRLSIACPLAAIAVLRLAVSSVHHVLKVAKATSSSCFSFFAFADMEVNILTTLDPAAIDGPSDALTTTALAKRAAAMTNVDDAMASYVQVLGTTEAAEF